MKQREGAMKQRATNQRNGAMTRREGRPHRWVAPHVAAAKCDAQQQKVRQAQRA